MNLSVPLLPLPHSNGKACCSTWPLPLRSLSTAHCHVVAKAKGQKSSLSPDIQKQATSRSLHIVLSAPFAFVCVSINLVRNTVITMNTPPASNPTSVLVQIQSPAFQPPAINFAIEWLDEDGCVCPKHVDYATQCPKGHALVPFDGNGVPHAQQASDTDVMCRVCHVSTLRQHTYDWLVCSVAGCCGGYAVCAACVAQLGCSRRAIAASTDDLCMMVSNNTFFISSLFQCFCFALTMSTREFRWSTCGG